MGRARAHVRGAAAQFGAARIDFERHEATVRGVSIKLTNLELELVKYFTQNPERVISRDELLEQVWKLPNYPNTRTVDNFVLRLRRHFEEDPTRPVHFVSDRGRAIGSYPVEPRPSDDQPVVVTPSS